MKQTEEMKKFILGVIEEAKKDKLDLISDSITYNFFYEEHPGVQISIMIGGLFTEDLDYELEGELH